MVERVNPVLPVSRQCRLLAVSRSAVYRKPPEVSAEDLAIMALLDRHYLARPYYGSRRMAAWLATQGHVVNRKRVQRLMRLLGLVAIYQRPNTSKPAAAHKVYPYLLGGIAIERVNQVWCADVTYIPMAKGFLYLVVIMDWVSRAVLAWRLCQLSRLLIDDVSAILPRAQAVSRMPSAIAALRMCCQRRVAAETCWRMPDRQRRKFRSSSWPRQYRLADPVLFNPSIGRHRPLMPR